MRRERQAQRAELTVLSQALRRLASRDWVFWVALAVAAANGVLGLVRHDWPWTWVDPVIGIVYLVSVFALTFLALMVAAEFVRGLREQRGA